MTEIKGAINSYICEKCNKGILTVLLETGTTPYLLGCRATENCDGTMKSSFYRLTQPTHEWYKPSEKELKTHRPEVKEHVKMGGLLIRER